MSTSDKLQLEEQLDKLREADLALKKQKERLQEENVRLKDKIDDLLNLIDEYEWVLGI